MQDLMKVITGFPFGSRPLVQLIGSEDINVMDETENCVFNGWVCAF